MRQGMKFGDLRVDSIFEYWKNVGQAKSDLCHDSLFTPDKWGINNINDFERILIQKTRLNLNTLKEESVGDTKCYLHITDML